MQEKEENSGFIRWFSELSNKDIAIAGGKGASLAEMYNAKFPVPPGFMITAQTYGYFIEKAGLADKIKHILAGLNIEDTARLESSSKEVRNIIEKAEMPKEMELEILEAYNILGEDKNIENARKGAAEILRNSKEMPFVAVRSSATTEDLATASFAGAQESFLNVKGNSNLIESVKKCFASLFTARAVYYRAKKGFSHVNALLAVVIQKMIASDKSGVMFSKNPVSNKDEIVIEAVWGLGEGIVSGMIKPDNYVINGDLNNFKILETKVADKKIAIVRNSAGQNTTVNLTEERSNQQVLTSYEIKTLARYAKDLEEHYKKPQDIEFAIENKEIYIVQSRPITTVYSSEGEKNVSGKILVSGLGASPGIASGIVKIIRNLEDLPKVQKGDVLVTLMTSPDMVVSMEKASAIVTDEGGITSHASIVSREMGIPAVVGTGNATSNLQEGTIITVDGFSGKVYEGKGEAKAIEINPIIPTKTKIKVILDIPDFADRAALSGSKSVGLLRLEGIIAGSGRHPLHFLKNNKLNEYSSVLMAGIKKIAEHFDEVWIRTSDIRSDEYRHLQGAPQQVEGNPMLGNHGIRFSLQYKDILSSEIDAIKSISSQFPEKKFGIMFPQIINVEEFEEARRIALKTQMPENLILGIMVETPAAVQTINKLCEAGIKFVSFGTNDLTQYILAIDRNNSEVQHLYDEMNPAVLSALSYVIRRCKKYNVQTSICGQAGSKEEMAKFLVTEGIDSISVNADAAEKVSKVIAQVEESLSNSIKLKNDSSSQQNNAGKEDAKNETENDISNDAQIDALRGSQNDADLISKETRNENIHPQDDEYVPGSAISKNNEIPALNDAIPIDSELFNNRN